MRRASGEGSVFRRKDGRWVAVAPRPHRREFYGRSQAEARRKRDAFLLSGATPPPQTGGPSFAQFVLAWHERNAARWTDSTKRVYRQLTDRAEPVIGAVPLDSITPQHCEDVMQASATAAPSTRQSLRFILRAVFRSAVALGYIPSDPAEGLPAVKGAGGGTTGHPFNADELRAFLAAARDSKHEALVLMFVLCGLRIGEVIALTWQDIDAEARTIIISKQAIRQDGGGMRVMPVKTRSSNRVIQVGRGVIAALERHREAQGRERYGYSWEPSPLVFTGRWGRLLSDVTVRNAVRQVMRAAGVPLRRPHDLRHTAATHQLRRRTPLKTVSALLGHSSAAVTLTTYSHLVPGMLDEAADVMDQIADD